MGTLHEAGLRHAAYYSTVLRTAQRLYDRGGKNIDRGLELFSGDRQGEASDLGNLGNEYLSLGEIARAVEHYEQALAIYREGFVA